MNLLKSLQKIMILLMSLFLIQASISCCIGQSLKPDHNPELSVSTQSTAQTYQLLGNDQLPSINVTITRPQPNSFYFGNNLVFYLDNNVVVYGGIDITANVTSDEPVDRVEFYINDILKHTDTNAPYNYSWNAIKSFRYTIKVIAYDATENSSEDSIEILKWRIHPLVIIAGGAIGVKILSRLLGDSLLGHTIIRGSVFNLKQQGRFITFKAIRLRYTEFSPTKKCTGVLKFQKCRIRDPGFDRQYDFGPLGSYTYIFGICRGSLEEL